ncbi:hypothetical protein [Maricaulis sp.]|uniref:hypothetical protein n=1 Tax=Maricaulis sp. TaxID=1486257 RepID=UPI0025BB7B57|nr:hypothetical protein [Maricaulis sp.]
MWREIGTAPEDRDIELAVIDEGEAHPLVFPCRRGSVGWHDASTGQRVDVDPTHWREWSSEGGGNSGI